MLRHPVAPAVALLACLAAAAVHRASLPPRLPERVAVHIGPDGAADRWVPRDEFLRDADRAWRTVALVLLGVGGLVTLLVRFGPAGLVNLPRKDEWMGTPRGRAQASAIVLGFFVAVAAAGAGLGIAITEDLVRASATGRGSGLGLAAVGGFVAVVFGLVGWMCFQLARGPRRRGR